MKTPRKTNPIDDMINELNKPILLLRELKKANKEIERLKRQLNYVARGFGTVKDMEDKILELSVRNGYLEGMVKKYKEKLNATS
jgi:hypothetical protein